MIASPSVAIDLPLKVLASEDGEGRVWVSYNSPEYLKQRHKIPDALLPNISGRLLKKYCDSSRKLLTTKEIPWLAFLGGLNFGTVRA